MDVKLVMNVSHPLRMRITRQRQLICVDQERQIGILAAEYSVHHYTHVCSSGSSKSIHPSASIPFRQSVDA